MDSKKKEALLKCGTFEELLDEDFGKVGTPERNLFDAETREFCIAQVLREERINAGLTQEQLSERIGTKKTYISRIENGKQNIQLSTLFRIFDSLGRKVAISIL